VIKQFEPLGFQKLFVDPVPSRNQQIKQFEPLGFQKLFVDPIPSRNQVFLVG
jgi:hypothetical protein